MFKYCYVWSHKEKGIYISVICYYNDRLMDWWGKVKLGGKFNVCISPLMHMYELCHGAVGYITITFVHSQQIKICKPGTTCFSFLWMTSNHFKPVIYVLFWVSGNTLLLWSYIYAHVVVQVICMSLFEFVVMDYDHDYPMAMNYKLYNVSLRLYWEWLWWMTDRLCLMNFPVLHITTGLSISIHIH